MELISSIARRRCPSRLLDSVHNPCTATLHGDKSTSTTALAKPTVCCPFSTSRIPSLQMRLSKTHRPDGISSSVEDASAEGRRSGPVEADNVAIVIGPSNPTRRVTGGKNAFTLSVHPSTTMFCKSNPLCGVHAPWFARLLAVDCGHCESVLFDIEVKESSGCSACAKSAEAPAEQLRHVIHAGRD